MKESKQNQIRIKETKTDTFLSVLKFLYLGWLEFKLLNLEQLFDLIRTADRFLLFDLKAQAQAYISDKCITLENVNVIQGMANAEDWYNVLKATTLFMEKQNQTSNSTSVSEPTAK